MKIRNLKFKDFEDIIDMYDEPYDEVKEDPNFGDILRLKRPSHETAKKWAEKMYKEVMNGNVIFTVAEEHGKIVGFSFVRKKDYPQSEISHVGIITARVRKGWRGKGIGSQLLQTSIKRSKGKFEIIDLNVIAINKGAIKLYKRLGFKQWGVAPHYMKRGKKYIDLIYMYKPI